MVTVQSRAAGLVQEPADDQPAESTGKPPLAGATDGAAAAGAAAASAARPVAPVMTATSRRWRREGKRILLNGVVSARPPAAGPRGGYRENAPRPQEGS